MCRCVWEKIIIGYILFLNEGLVCFRFGWFVFCFFPLERFPRNWYTAQCSSSACTHVSIGRLLLAQTLSLEVYFTHSKHKHTHVLTHNTNTHTYIHTYTANTQTPTYTHVKRIDIFTHMLSFISLYIECNIPDTDTRLIAGIVRMRMGPQLADTNALLDMYAHTLTRVNTHTFPYNTKKTKQTYKHTHTHTSAHMQTRGWLRALCKCAWTPTGRYKCTAGYVSAHIRKYTHKHTHAHTHTRTHTHAQTRTYTTRKYSNTHIAWTIY